MVMKKNKKYSFLDRDEKMFNYYSFSLKVQDLFVWFYIYCRAGQSRVEQLLSMKRDNKYCFSYLWLKFPLPQYHPPRRTTGRVVWGNPSTLEQFPLIVGRQFFIPLTCGLNSVCSLRLLSWNDNLCLKW